MTKKEAEKIGELITQLDEAVGKLIVPAMKDRLIQEAKEQVSKVSFELGLLM